MAKTSQKHIQSLWAYTNLWWTYDTSTLAGYPCGEPTPGGETSRGPTQRRRRRRVLVLPTTGHIAAAELEVGGFEALRAGPEAMVELTMEGDPWRIVGFNGCLNDYNEL